MDPMIQGQIKEWFVMIAAYGLFFTVAFLMAGIFRRRQQQTMQKALLDKFSSAQDFAEFMQSPAGQKYLMSFTDAVTSPSSAIMNSIRTGCVAALAGLGFIVANEGPQTISFRVGWVLFLGGTGFLIAAGISYFLAKKLDTGMKG
jgi:hypothetical protein